MEKLDRGSSAAPSASSFRERAATAKASVIGKGEQAWRAGTWEDVDRAGGMIADEITAAIGGGLTAIPPGLRSYLTEMELPLDAPPDRIDARRGGRPNPKPIRRACPTSSGCGPQEQLSRLKRGYALRRTVPILVHGLRLGPRIAAGGNRSRARWPNSARLVRDAYPSGVTFPFGYTDGAQLYLVSSPMLKEGGYEPESYWEYRQPAPLAGGHERILLRDGPRSSTPRNRLRARMTDLTPVRFLSVSAPARICLFGEHSDYLGMSVITAAIDLRLRISGTPRSDRRFHINLPDIHGSESFDVDGELPTSRNATTTGA